MREMTTEEVREFLGHNKAGILSLAEEGNAYGVPLYYGYDGHAVYFLARNGLKAKYLRATRESCFTVVRVMSIDSWASVQVFGRVETLTDATDRISAGQALLAVPLPPEWGESAFGEPLRGVERPLVMRLIPQRATGRYSEMPPISKEEKEIALGGM